MPPQRNNPSPYFPGAGNQVRKHYFLDRYVIMAPQRGLRPDSFHRHDAPHKQASNKGCPFCHNEETALYRRPASGDWQVKVVANKYPALTLDNTEAFGAHEVIIETPDHHREFSELSHAEQVAILNAYRHRLSALSAVPGIRYVQVIKNDGPLAGASVAHAHSQVLALPIIPPHVEHEAQGMDHYRAEHGSCAICDIINWEEEQTVRVVYSDKYVVAIAPYAASAPFGVWILPRRHEGQFTALMPSEIASFATALGFVSARLDSGSISFNWFLANALPHEDHHFVWKLEPRGTPWAGAEMGTGIAINPVPAEYAALWYKGKI